MYYDWMLKRYLGKDTPRGDLAGDMKRSGDFPRCDDKRRILRYLQSKNACDEAIGVFKRSFRDYEKSVHEKEMHSLNSKEEGQMSPTAIAAAFEVQS